MMKTKYILQYLCAIVFCMAFVSCQDDEFFTGDGEVRLRLSATFQSDANEGRAVLSNEMDIDGYTFLYFRGTGGDAELIKFDYITKDKLPYSVVVEAPTSGTRNRAFLLANVTLDDLGSITKLSDLNNKSFSIDHKANKPTNAKDFTWSGFADVERSTTTLDFVLNPNVAKFNVSITDNSSESQVVSVRLRRVRTQVRFAQAALCRMEDYTECDSENDFYLDQANRSYVDYDIEEISLNHGETKSFSWYAPYNEPFHDRSNANLTRRNGGVPAGSTYIEFDGVKNNTNLCTFYRLYPGVKKGNEDYLDIDNFNVIAGDVYNITASITDDGLTGDVNSGYSPTYKNTSYKVKLPEKSNCYMLHPKVQRQNSATTVWEMPIYQRINEYWGTNWGYSGVGNVSDNVITDNTEWTMEVIWQDIQNRVLYFTDEVGTSSKDTYEGVGKNPVYIKLDTDRVNSCISNRGAYNDKTGIYRNIVVGVKEKGSSTYLWSWHLWITDYYPYELSAYSSGGKMEYDESKIDYQEYYFYNNGSYTLSKGGTAHHYGGNDSDKTSYMGNGWKWSSHTSDNVWDGSGIYSKKWIMDRNLGSQAPSNGDIRDPFEAFGTYYQYGRKDPIPVQATSINFQNKHDSSLTYLLNFYNGYNLYNIDGKAKTSSKFAIVDKRATMNEAVQNPTTIYTFTNQNEGSWTTFEGGTNWFSPEKNLKTGGKTIFDPCPPGYCIPTFDAFDFMNSNIWVNNTTGLYSPPLIAFRPTSSNSGGLANVPYRTMCIVQTKKGSQTLEVVFPCQGNINPDNGLLEVPSGEIGGANADARGYYWVLDRKADDTSYGNTGYQKVAPTKYQGQAIGMGNGYRAVTSTSIDHDHWPNSTTEKSTRNGYEYYVYCYAGYRENFSASRGHNIRCIQIPD